MDGRFMPGSFGGVEPAAAGLVSALADEPGDAQYALLVYRGHSGWLPPNARAAMQIVEVDPPVPSRRPRVPARLRSIVPAVRIPPVPVSDGTAERLGADVVHFTYQNGFRTAIPTIYQPWDLQHVHLPEFFTPRERALRDRWYRELSGQAAAVVVASNWTRDDLIAQLGVPAEKVHVIPAGAALFSASTPAGEALAAARARVGDGRFALYPASTYPHKNHERLLQAVAQLRAEGVAVRVVCTGIQTRHVSGLRRAARALGVDDAVCFLGYVTEPELRALYALARSLIFPSLFEGWGLPVAEAFAAGVPVACSTSTSLPELAGDAARLFDPRDVAAIAAALEQLWTDDALCAELVRRGHRRAAKHDWGDVARRFRALYAQVA